MIEKLPKNKNEMSKDEFERLLTFRLFDVSQDDLKSLKKTFVFSVTPSYEICISGKSHESMSREYGVDLDKTLAEGYIEKWKKSGLNVDFKANYQPVKGFGGTEREEGAFHDAIRNKIKEFIEG